MKRSALAIVVALTGCAVLAQQPAPAAPPRGAPAVGPAAATNSTNPWIELRDLEAKLHPVEARLLETDPEIKAILLKRKALQAELIDLDKKKQEKLSLRLAADPALAPLEARRKELLKKVTGLGATNTLGGVGGRPNALAPRAPAPVVVP